VHLNAITCTIIPKPVSVELPPIVEDHGLWNSEASHNVLLDQLAHFILNDGCYCLRLHPFREVIYSHWQKLSLPCCFRKWAQNIHAPSSERQRGVYSG